jgi:formate hydrogenlyase subunit 3/multisubunit Na+/H+ antiporter MnhD subunit
MNADIYGNLFTAMAILFASAVIVPLVSSRRTLAGWLNFILVSAACVIILYTCYNLVFEAMPQVSRLVSFGVFSIYFLVDGLSAFFLAVIAFMAVISAFYSIDYMEHYHDYSLNVYYANFPIFILGMIGIVTVDDLSLGFTISWQLMTVASYFLIKFEKKDANVVRGANKYLLLMELAWLFIFIAPFFVKNVSFGDSLHTITQGLSVSSPAAVYAVFGLVILGFAFKAGIFPFGQLWLPDAHSIAPSPISALLSGVMIKTGVYGIIRTLFWMVPHSETFHFNGSLWGILIATLGVLTLFIGTVQSMKQNDSKRLLAYSSIGQIGYIIFATGAGLFMFYSDNSMVKFLSLIAVVGAVYHVLNHAIFKGLLFLTSGSVLYATGTKDLDRLGGLLKLMPVSAVVAGIASLSISGVPPFSGFASKWTIVSTSLLAGSEYLFLAIFGIIALFTSAVTLSCYVKFFGMTFTSSGSEWNVTKKVHEVKLGMLLPKLVLAALCIVQGLLPFFFFETIITIFQKSRGSILHGAFNDATLTNHLFGSSMGVQVAIPGLESVSASAAVPAVVLAVFAAGLLLSWLLRGSAGSTNRNIEPWLGGYQDLHDTTRYRNRSMFSALKKVLRWTGGDVR